MMPDEPELPSQEERWLDAYQKLQSRINALEAENLRLQSQIRELESQIRKQGES